MPLGRSVVDAARSIFQPTVEQLRRREGEGEGIVARPDLLLRIGPLVTDPWSSTVHWARWSADQVDAGIGEVLDLFRKRRQAFVWLVADTSSPPSIGERLEAAGFIRELQGKMLVALLPLDGLRTNRDVVVKEVRDRAGVREAIRVDHPDWDDDRAADLVDERVRRLGGDWHLATAYLDGHPAGTARWRIDRELGAVELRGAETLPEHRRRGVYSTLVAFRAEQAAREGCTFATIVADLHTSGPILTKRGFEDLGPATYFLWPARFFEL
jgi:GNAT superfamily N-acetyltransferase